MEAWNLNFWEKKKKLFGSFDPQIAASKCLQLDGFAANVSPKGEDSTSSFEEQVKHGSTIRVSSTSQMIGFLGALLGFLCPLGICMIHAKIEKTL